MPISFFSQSKKTKSLTGDVPPEILKLVRTMGDSSTHLVENHSTSMSQDSSRKEVTNKERKITSSPFLDGEFPMKGANLEPAPKTLPTPDQLGLKKSGLAAPVKGDLELQKSKHTLWYIIGAIIALLLIIGGALYWFLMKKQVSNMTIETQNNPTVELSTTIVNTPTIAAPFTLNQPNYLSVDTETVTLADIKNTLNQAGNRMLEAKMTAPVEFIITDKNNNPLAFSRLAFLTNIELDSELLSMLGEAFTLSLYNDAGVIHTGMTLTLNNVAEGAALIQKEEVEVPFAFQNFFFEGVNVPRRLSFRSGTYNSIPVRYVNIDTTKNLSFDYALNGSEWMIGTSKDTLRAVIDKNK